jgi:hypothetical protein
MPAPAQAQMWDMADCRPGYTYNAERNVCVGKKAKKAAKKTTKKKPAKKKS